LFFFFLFLNLIRQIITMFYVIVCCFLVYSKINKTFVPKVPHFLEGTPFKDVVMLEKYF
jgi:hypothetical protein